MLGFVACVFLRCHLRTTPPHTWPEKDGVEVIAGMGFVCRSEQCRDTRLFSQEEAQRLPLHRGNTDVSMSTAPIQETPLESKSGQRLPSLDPQTIKLSWNSVYCVPDPNVLLSVDRETHLFRFSLKYTRNPG